MSVSLKLKMNLKEQGAVAGWLSENKKTSFSISALSLDKDFKFNDGVIGFEHKGVGKFNLEVRNNNLTNFLITLQHPDHADWSLSLGGSIESKGLKVFTVNPTIELKVGEVKITGEIAGRSLKEPAWPSRARGRPRSSSRRRRLTRRHEARWWPAGTCTFP